MNDNAWSLLKHKLSAKGIDVPTRFGERLRLWQLLERELASGVSTEEAIDTAWGQYQSGERRPLHMKEGGCDGCADAGNCELAESGGS